MNKKSLISSLFVISILSGSLNAGKLFEFLGDQKKGTTALLFLKISPGGLPNLMGNIGVSLSEDATSLYWNPSLGSFLKTDKAFSFNYRRWIVEQHYAYVGGIIKIGKYTRIGGYMISLNSGYFKERDEYHPFGTGKYINAMDFAGALVMSRHISDRFAFGIGVKFVYESLADVHGYTALIDVGTIYDVGYKDIKIGVSLSNLGPDFGLKGEYTDENGQVQEYDKYSVPVIYRIGVKGKIKDWLISGFEIDKPSDDVEHFKLGFGFMPIDYVILGFGLRLNNTPPGDNYLTRGLNFGLMVRKRWGIHKQIFVVYSGEALGYLGISHTITTGVNF